MTFLIAMMLLTPVQTTAGDAATLMNAGRSKLAQVGAMAAQGDFAAAASMTQSAIADLDRAVLLEPGNLEVRLTRGIAYAGFPDYFGKSGAAREDLETAVRHSAFPSLPEERRARTIAALERLNGGQTRTDRFPEVEEDISPVIVVLTITFPAASYRSQAEARTAEISHAVEGFPGLLGRHFLASVDKPGMFVIFTWWKGKKEASDFYYSDLHQSWMNGRGQAITTAPNIPSEQIPSQVSVEIFGRLPGGIQMNGGLTPAEIFR